MNTIIKYANLTACFLIALMMPQFFFGFSDGSLRMSENIKTNHFLLVMQRAWQYFQPAKTPTAEAGRILFGPMLRSANFNNELKTTQTQAQIGTYAVKNGQKPYFLPVEIGSYKSGSITRGAVDALLKKNSR